MEKLIIKQRHFVYIACMIILPFFGACQKNEPNRDELKLKCPFMPKNGADDNVLGKWKLVKGRGSMMAPTPAQVQDYSCNNVIYHFQEDGTLHITGVSEGMISYPNGQYFFELKDDQLFEAIEEKYTLELGTTTTAAGRVACGIQENIMILNNSFIDGSKLTLYRVE